MSKYSYNNEDITLDMMIKIEQIVRILSEKNQITFDEMLEKFYASKTYKALINTKNCLWAESSEFIADEYERELMV